ncbi:MAG: hypothetical protein DRN05_05525, partial [Thermoplasmata archaeon]
GEIAAWVNIISLNANHDTKIWMYYGNPTCSSQQNPADTWDSYFGGVWHLNEINAIDSSGNGNNGTQTGDPTVNTGIVNSSVDFHGTPPNTNPDYISLGTDSSIDLANADTYTIEMWVYMDSNAVDQMFFTQSQGSSSWNIGFGTHDNDIPNNHIKHITRDDDGTSRDVIDSETIATGCWIYIAGTYNNGIADNKTIYINGTLANYTNSGINNLRDGPTTATLIGYGGDLGAYDGRIDELRISTNVRSSGWIQTTYNTIKNPASFLSLGTEETQTA